MKPGDIEGVLCFAPSNHLASLNTASLAETCVAVHMKRCMHGRHKNLPMYCLAQPQASAPPPHERQAARAAPCTGYGDARPLLQQEVAAHQNLL